MIYVINIGNTNTQIGIFQNGNVSDVISCLTSDFELSLLPKNIPLAFATVVPGIRTLFDARDAFEVSYKCKLGILLDSVDPSTLGADRIANAVALSMESCPAICIDCGTALTFEAVDENLQFRGGAIAPGRMLLRKALNDYTAQLPLVPFENSIPEIGTNTSDSILCGVDNGILGTVKEILSNIKKVLGSEDCRIVAVGGDASFLAEHIPEIVQEDETFTLRGIGRIWELNN